MSIYAFDINQQQSEDDNPLFPVRLDGKWGYIDIDGQLVIKPQFDYACDFTEGFAAVRLKSGDFIDHAEKPGNRGAFSDKLGRFTPVEKYGFIDKSGTYLVAPRYEHADFFSESRALVRVGCIETGKFGYIDRSGYEIIKPQFGSNGFTKNDCNFSEGLAPVRIDGKIAFIDYSGSVLFKTRFDHAWGFSDGLAMVRKGSIQNGYYGYIDNEGNVAIDLKYRLAHGFSEGLAGAMVENWTKGLFGFINRKGEFEIEPRYRMVGSYHDGLAWAWKADLINAFLAIASGVAFEPNISGTWELIDKNGEVKLKLRNGWVGNFYFDYALRKYGGKSSFIDRNAKECFNKIFDNALPFRNGLAMVQVDEKWGYINRNGNYVWQPSE